MEEKKQPHAAETPRGKQLHLAVLKQMLVLATSGFGLVAALAWNNAIQELVALYIKPYFPKGGFISLLVYAIIITIIAVIVTINLSRLIEKLEKKNP
jgi:polyferredoxin